MHIRFHGAVLIILLTVLNPIQAHAWWWSDPTISQYYSLEELKTMVVSQQAVIREHDIYVLDRGNVFRYDSKGVKYAGSYDAKAILSYRGKIVALANNGEIDLFTENKGIGQGDWYKIGSSAEAIQTDNVDLFAQTRDKGWFGAADTLGVWVYLGQPGEMQWTLMPIFIPMSCGNNCTTMMTILVPMQAGRAIAFTDMNLPGATGLQMNNGKVFASFEDGSVRQVSKETAGGAEIQKP